MTDDRISRHRTAIHRSELSRPIRLALKDGMIGPDAEVLDYGCGHGDDLERLAALGIGCKGWDPTYRPNGECTSSAIANLGYVVNVIESREERAAVLRDSWALAQSMLIVSARLQHELRGEVLSPYGDGWLTKTGTFQKYYDQRELSQWIDEVLGVQSVAAGPEVFYVFRDLGQGDSHRVALQADPNAPYRTSGIRAV